MSDIVTWGDALPLLIVGAVVPALWTLRGFSSTRERQRDRLR
jgi:hypothetical protein